MKPAWMLLSLCVLALPAGARQLPAFSVAVTDAPGQRFAAAQYGKDKGCTGANASPTLAWQGAPATAKSFAITMFDPDANGGKGLWHWLATGIPATSKGLESGASGSLAMTALGVTEASNDMGQTHYNGPCPPVGQDHHYVITVYALDVNTLELPAGTKPADVNAAIGSHAIAKAETTLRAAR